MAFVPENALEEALDRAAADPMARVAFYHALMDAPLVVFGRAAAAPGSAQQNLTISSLRHNGREYLPIFSAKSRLVTFAGEAAAYFEMPGRQLFETTKGANFVLN